MRRAPCGMRFRGTLRGIFVIGASRLAGFAGIKQELSPKATPELLIANLPASTHPRINACFRHAFYEYRYSISNLSIDKRQRSCYYHV